ncbi:MAG: Bax inhibitor-1/YccA family protein [Endomicrobiaceae bacterium]|nr:Bax inhibitor-1/YccA family protein [Endomicrobiaceae bacterium]
MNPVMSNKTFSNLGYNQETMTVKGTINKSFFLWAILAVGAYLGWGSPNVFMPLIWPLIIVSFILAIVTVFKKHIAPWTSPIYAFCEGLFLGVITLFFEKSYPGIAVNAVFLTISVLFCMLFAFRAGYIRATNKFYAVVGVSTMAIMLLYVVNLIITMFGGAGIGFIYSSSTFGILFSVAVVIIASLNLIIDFDIIQKGAMSGAPKYMEWYGAFALMITLVWLYLEILRLLSKIRN